MKTRRRFSPTFKKQAIEMVENGRAAAEVAVELEIPVSCLYAWIRHSNPLEIKVIEPHTAPEDPGELLRLRRENAHLKRENDILKKAAIILGSDPLFRTEK